MTKNKELVKAAEFSQDQIQLIKSQIAPEATNDELKLFMYYAQRTGLDPLARQIYCIHRNTKQPDGSWKKKMSIQTAIDGFRVVAERSNQYAGQSEPKFDEINGKPSKCTISVYRFANKSAGIRYEAGIGVAYWDEYVQTNQQGQPIGLWAKMPHTMLSKVAEAVALRKAFPQDLSGIYSADELPIEATEIITLHEPKLEKLTSPIETPLPVQQKPLMSAPQFKKAKDRISAKEKKVIERLEDIFTLTDTQRKELQEAEKNANAGETRAPRYSRTNHGY